MNNHKSYNLLKAVSSYTISNLLINGISFFVLPLFTRLMSPEEYGVYGLYTSYYSIFEILVVFGGISTIKIAKFDKSLDYEIYVSTMMIVPVVLTLIVAGVINFLFIFSTDILSMDIKLWNLLFITGLFASLSNIIVSKFAVDGEFKLKVTYSVLLTLINVGLSLSLCYSFLFSNEKYYGRIFGLLAANVLCFIYAFKNAKLKRIDFKYLKIFFKWSGPLLFHTIATILIIQSDRLILKQLTTFSVVGIYTIATTLVSIPMVIQTSVESSWSPWFLEKLDKKEYELIRDVNKIYVILFGAIIALFMLVSPEMIHLFTDKKYWDAAYALVPLSISIFAEMLYCIPVNLEFFYKKTIFIFLGTVSTLIINIILDFILIKEFNWIGAAYATAFSRIILFVLHLFIAKRIDKESILNVPLTVGFLVCLFSINFFIVLNVNLILVRYILCFLIMFYLLFFVKKNLYLIKSLRG